MIHSSLSFLTNELNEYLKLRTGTPDDRVFLTSVATDDGIIIPDKSLGVSLINIEEERIFKEQRTTFINDNGLAEHMNPEVKLNLYALISANFQNQQANNPSDDYVEGLKQLSYVIAFFQSRNVFSQDNSPSMAVYDPDMLKLVVELYSYSFEQLYNFWTVVGTKYLPSVLYKIRIVKFQEHALLDSNLPIEKVKFQSHQKV